MSGGGQGDWLAGWDGRPGGQDVMDLASNEFSVLKIIT